MAIDPSTTCYGWAVYCRGAFAFGACKARGTEWASSPPVSTATGKRLLVIEDQRARKSDPNAQSIIWLAQAAARTATRLAPDYEVWVLPSMWKSPKHRKPEKPHEKDPEHYSVHRIVQAALGAGAARDAYDKAVRESPKYSKLEIVDAAGILVSTLKGSIL